MTLTYHHFPHAKEFTVSLFRKVFYTPIVKPVLLHPRKHVFPKFDNSCKIARPVRYSEAHLNPALREAIVNWNDLLDSIVTIADHQKFQKTITRLSWNAHSRL